MRAFAIRFAVFGTFMAVLVAIAALVAPDRMPASQWSVVLVALVVGGGAVYAVVAHVADQLSWNEHTFGHDERTWRQLVGFDREENRRRRRERRFANSAAAGGLWILGGLAWFSLYWATGDDTAWTYIVTSLVVVTGARLVWAGFRRWRAGGEFNLPGRAGPILREPPRETRGD